MIRSQSLKNRPPKTLDFDAFFFDHRRQRKSLTNFRFLREKSSSFVFLWLSGCSVNDFRRKTVRKCHRVRRMMIVDRIEVISPQKWRLNSVNRRNEIFSVFRFAYWFDLSLLLSWGRRRRCSAKDKRNREKRRSTKPSARRDEFEKLNFDSNRIRKIARIDFYCRRNPINNAANVSTNRDKCRKISDNNKLFLCWSWRKRNKSNWEKIFGFSLLRRSDWNHRTDRESRLDERPFVVPLNDRCDSETKSFEVRRKLSFRVFFPHVDDRNKFLFSRRFQ